MLCKKEQFDSSTLATILLSSFVVPVQVWGIPGIARVLGSLATAMRCCHRPGSVTSLGAVLFIHLLTPSECVNRPGSSTSRSRHGDAYRPRSHCVIDQTSEKTTSTNGQVVLMDMSNEWCRFPGSTSSLPGPRSSMLPSQLDLDYFGPHDESSSEALDSITARLHPWHPLWAFHRSQYKDCPCRSAWVLHRCPEDFVLDAGKLLVQEALF